MSGSPPTLERFVFAAAHNICDQAYEIWAGGGYYRGRLSHNSAAHQIKHAWPVRRLSSLTLTKTVEAATELTVLYTPAPVTCVGSQLVIKSVRLRAEDSWINFVRQSGRQPEPPITVEDSYAWHFVDLLGCNMEIDATDPRAAYLADSKLHTHLAGLRRQRIEYERAT